MRRLFLIAVIVLASMAAVPGAWAGGDLPDSLQVRFGDGVTAETRWYVEEALQQAWATFAPHLMDPHGLEALVVVVTNSDDAAAVWAEERGISEDRARRQFTARSSHFAGLATRGLAVIVNDNLGDAGATVHELAHLVQHHVAGAPLGPRWLTEGGAEYFDLLIAERWGIDAAAEPPKLANRTIADEWAATTNNCRADLLKQDSETCTWALESLDRLEAGGPFNVGGGAVSAYSRARVAFQTLMDQTSVQEYFCYLEEKGSGATWRAAFASCFGQGVDEFYDDFAHSRDRGFIRHVPSRRLRML